MRLRTFRLLKGIFVVIAFAVIGWVAYVKPNWILDYSVFTWASTFYLIFLIFTPAGGVVLGEREKRLPFLGWWGIVLFGNIIMITFTAAVMVAYLGAGPSFTQGALAYGFTVEVVSEFTKTHWGFFPWSIYAMWALGLGYYTYVKKGMPCLYQMAEPFVPKWFEPAVKTFVESTNYTCTWFALGMVTLAIVLLAAYILNVMFGFSHFIIPLVTLTVFCFITPVFSFKWGRKLFSNLATRKASLFGMLLVMIIILAPIVMFAGFGNGFLAKQYPEFVTQADCPNCHMFFAHASVSDRFASMYWGWWLLWCPFIGSALTRISYGRTLREVTIGMFSVPLVGWILIEQFGEKPVKALVASLNHPNVLPIFLGTLALVSLWFLFILTCRHRFSDLFITGFMSVSDKYKRNRLWLKDAPKIIGMSKYGPKLANTIVGLLILHTISGWYLMQVQIAAMGAVMINLVYAIFNLTIIQFFIDKVWIGNKNIPPLKTAYVGLPKKTKYKKGH